MAVTPIDTVLYTGKAHTTVNTTGVATQVA
jgi:hypothetical protein